MARRVRLMGILAARPLQPLPPVPADKHVLPAVHRGSALLEGAPGPPPPKWQGADAGRWW